jgi:non-specific serine/threonine protein kinase
VQWSVDQLAPDELDLFARLGVFVAPWTLEAAVAVAGDVDEFAVLDQLTRLADRSLLVVLPADHQGARYRYLETVRIYALERLAERGDPAPVRDLHLGYFVAAAENSVAVRIGPEQQRWLDRFDREHDDMLAAHDWCGLGGGADRALADLRLVGSVWWFWSARSHYALARRVLAEALARPEAQTPSAARAAALVRAGGFALLEGDHEAARPWIEESLAVCRAVGDRKGVARSLGALATIAIYRDDLEEAELRARESLEAYRALGQHQGTFIALQNLGHVARHRGDLAAARAHLDEALATAERTGDGRGQAISLIDLAYVDLQSGDPAGAGIRLFASLERVRSLQAQREGAYALEAFAGLAETMAEAIVAARALGAAAALRVSIGSPPAPAERRELETRVERLRSAAGSGPVDEAIAAGSRDPFDRAIASAMDWLGSSGPRAGSEPG